MMTHEEYVHFSEVTESRWPPQAVDVANHSWTNYVQAAYKGVFEHVQKHHGDIRLKPMGLNMVIEGQVPQGECVFSVRRSPSLFAKWICASSLDMQR